MEVSKSWKIAEFPKISIKIVKHFTRPKQRAALSKLFSLSLPSLFQLQTDKMLPRLWNKKSFTDIYRHIHALSFKVFPKCSSLASRNGAIQIFFLTPNRKSFAGKFIKWKKFLVVFRGHISINVEWDEARRTSGIFEQTYIVKWVIWLIRFCWLWDFLLENLKLIKLSDNVHWHGLACPK